MATVNLHWRAATQDDASRIQQLVQSAFQAEDSRPNWVGNAELASSFRLDVADVSSNIAKPDMVTLIALDDGDNLVATIEVSKRGTDVGRLSMIAVDERYQRGGVGRKVLSYAEDYCRRTWQVKMFSLDALSTRPALIEWYLRRGYRKTGETSPFPRERFPDLGLPDDLAFIEMDKVF